MSVLVNYFPYKVSNPSPIITMRESRGSTTHRIGHKYA